VCLNYLDKVTKLFFSGDFITFLELGWRDALSAVLTYNWQNVFERSCADADVICMITSAIENNYIPIEQQRYQQSDSYLRDTAGGA
jgi:hypothetical protein